MIGLCTDSNSQLPAMLADRYSIAVVALTVTIDDVDHLEGIDLTPVDFYAAWADGHSPVVSTSQPSPGQFAAAYERLVTAGATEILSIHIAEAMSGTMNSARLGAQAVDVPVTIVDSGTASFGISCCTWAAAEAIAAGADIEMAAAIARKRSSALGSSFIVGVPRLIARSGRASEAGVEAAAAGGIPVLSMSGSDIAVLDTVKTVEDAATAMVDYALAWSPSSADGLRIAIGTSDESSIVVCTALTDRLTGHPALAENPVQYVIGPSVGAHTGPGTAGLFVF